MRTKCNRMDLIRNLNLWGNDIHNISVLRGMPNLEVLSLSVNRVNSLADLRHCLKLSELYLRKNDIRDLAEVQHLVNLRHLKVLWLNDNPCALLPNYRNYVLHHLPGLTKLDSQDVTDDERRRAAQLGPEEIQTCLVDEEPGEPPEQFSREPSGGPPQLPEEAQQPDHLIRRFSAGQHNGHVGGGGCPGGGTSPLTAEEQALPARRGGGSTPLAEDQPSEHRLPMGSSSMRRGRLGSSASGDDRRVVDDRRGSGGGDRSSFGTAGPQEMSMSFQQGDVSPYAHQERVAQSQQERRQQQQQMPLFGDTDQPFSRGPRGRGSMAPAYEERGLDEVTPRSDHLEQQMQRPPHHLLQQQQQRQWGSKESSGYDMNMEMLRGQRGPVHGHQFESEDRWHNDRLPDDHGWHLEPPRAGPPDERVWQRGDRGGPQQAGPPDERAWQRGERGPPQQAWQISEREAPMRLRSNGGDVDTSLRMSERGADTSRHGEYSMRHDDSHMMDRPGWGGGAGVMIDGPAEGELRRGMSSNVDRAGRADNILCAVMALIKELDRQGLELVRRAIEQRQGELRS